MDLIRRMDWSYWRGADAVLFIGSLPRNELPEKLWTLKHTCTQRLKEKHIVISGDGGGSSLGFVVHIGAEQAVANLLRADGWYPMPHAGKAHWELLCRARAVECQVCDLWPTSIEHVLLNAIEQRILSTCCWMPGLWPTSIEHVLLNARFVTNVYWACAVECHWATYIEHVLLNARFVTNVYWACAVECHWATYIEHVLLNARFVTNVYWARAVECHWATYIEHMLLNARFVSNVYWARGVEFQVRDQRLLSRLQSTVRADGAVKLLYFLVRAVCWVFVYICSVYVQVV